MNRISADQLEHLCVGAITAAGGDAATASALAAATVTAERRGKRTVGVAHLFDYLDALREGRLNPHPQPKVLQSRSAAITVDADGGIAQLAFERALPGILRSLRQNGVAVLSINNSYTVGELGYYTTHLAEQGWLALAAANSPALMAVYDAHAPVTGTNPLSFALPHADGVRSFDQASSAVAWVAIRDAAERGERIPEGWALDADGQPTTEAAAAVDGPLLPYGGIKGSNVALMIELLAVLSGGSFSLDAPPFDKGDRPPGVGLFLLALDPHAFDPAYVGRTEAHLTRLSDEFGVGFGRVRASHDEIQLPGDVYARLLQAQPEPQLEAGAEAFPPLPQ